MKINFTKVNQNDIEELLKVNVDNEKQAENKFSDNIIFGEVPRYLYLIKVKNYDFYKIGITNDLSKRLRDLQTGNPFPINIVFAVEADLNDYFGKEIIYLEKFLHKNYKERQIQNEWYRLTKIDVCKIFLFLNTSIYSRDLPDVIPGTGRLRDVIKNCS